MSLSRALVICFLAPALAQKEKSPTDCKTTYDLANTNLAATIQERCESLVEFSRCLGQFDKSEFMENELLEQQLTEQNRKNCEQYWKEDFAPSVRTARGNLEMSVDDAKDIKFYRHRREAVSVWAMNQEISDLKSTVKTLTDTVNGIQTLVSDQLKSITDSIANNKKSAEDASKGLSSTLAEQANSQKNELNVVKQNVNKVDQSLKQLESDTEAKLTSTVRNVNKALSGNVSSLNSQLQSVGSKVTKNEKSLGEIASSVTDRKIHMWSGGARSSNRGSGWHDFVLDRVEYDTAKPYFQKRSNTRFRALRDGLYRYKIQYMSHANSRCWSHHQFFVAGQAVSGSTHKYVYSWRDMTYDVTWNIKKNQDFYSRVHISNCGNPYRWHGASTWKSAHNRIQVEYIGQFAQKCEGTNQQLC